MLRRAALLLACAPLALACAPSRTAREEPTKHDAAPPGYPAGPYGIQVGDTLTPLVFKGYRPGVWVWTDLPVEEFHDPDGAKGTRALVIMLTAEWCEHCIDLASYRFRYYHDLYVPRGARFVDIIVQDRDMKAATQTTVDQWLARYPVGFEIGIDETKTLEAVQAFPAGWIVDPRTMKIHSLLLGWDRDLLQMPELEWVLRKNGG